MTLHVRFGQTQGYQSRGAGHRFCAAQGRLLTYAAALNPDGHRVMLTRDEDAARAALAVMDAHLAALNAGDGDALAATLQFPHYRLASGRLQVWETGKRYLEDFRARAGAGWGRSEWDFRNVLHACGDKVHVDVQFSRFAEDGARMGTFRSIWVITRIDGRWAAQLRSSFAA